MLCAVEITPHSKCSNKLNIKYSFVVVVGLGFVSVAILFIDSSDLYCKSFTIVMTLASTIKL
jgi:hypothetical protein